MIRQEHVSTLRQTHRAASATLPLLTAALTVTGAVIAALESREPRAASAGGPASGSMGGATGDGENAQAGGMGSVGASEPWRATTRRHLTLSRYVATLLGRLLLIALGAALLIALVYVATASGRTGQAVLLTALILLALYLAEKVARRHA